MTELWQWSAAIFLSQQMSISLQTIRKHTRRLFRNRATLSGCMLCCRFSSSVAVVRASSTPAHAPAVCWGRDPDPRNPRACSPNSSPRRRFHSSWLSRSRQQPLLKRTAEKWWLRRHCRHRSSSSNMVLAVHWLRRRCLELNRRKRVKKRTLYFRQMF